MIFVTVGTHEQQFNRLVKYMDIWAREHDEEVIIQTGYSTYEPKYCKWCKMFPYNTILEIIEKARIVITHGGPSSFIIPLQMNKIPIVVPRQNKYGEHVNDHQVSFINEIIKRSGNIIGVENISDLEEIILDYDNIIAGIFEKGVIGNNTNFCTEFDKMVNQMYFK
ncbi:MAG: multidrug MFS transporter [Lachnospiraceae bacterium]|nr:multidrug MFS transporter [Lachnospiraceae bacterium]